MELSVIDERSSVEIFVKYKHLYDNLWLFENLTLIFSFHYLLYKMHVPYTIKNPNSKVFFIS